MPDSTTLIDANKILTDLYNNCDPIKPADQNFYVDCTEERGGNRFTTKLCKELSEIKGYIHTLFTGHIGCGKSSELQHLAKLLNYHTPKPGRKRFFTVVVKMLQYVDENDTQISEILLALVTELADALRSKEGIELEAKYLTRLATEFKTLLFSEADIPEGEVNFGFFKMKIRQVRTDPTTRTQVRKALAPRTTQLVEAINELFKEVREKLTAKYPKDGGEKYSDFVLVLDDLEKIWRVEDKDTQDASQKALFIESAPQLTALQAHVVYTVPLSLVRDIGGQLTDSYGRPPFVLPMVKTEERSRLDPDNRRVHPSFDKGKIKLRELLGKRLPTGTKLENVFDEDALEFVIKYSGGHIRNLIRFVRNAAIEGDGVLPINLKQAQSSVRDTISILTPVIRPEDWKLLATLETSDEMQWDSNKANSRRLLENICVMEYIDGGDDNPFDEAAPWYAVNPLLRETRLLKNAVENLQESPAVNV